jgi:hypothetical protein
MDEDTIEHCAEGSELTLEVRQRSRREDLVLKAFEARQRRALDVYSGRVDQAVIRCSLSSTWLIQGDPMRIVRALGCCVLIVGVVGLVACDDAKDPVDGTGDAGSSGGGNGPGPGTSAGVDGGGGAPTGAPGGPAIGPASFPNFSTEDNEKFLAGIVGTHDVAIYRMPEGREAEVGPAKLAIEGTASAFKATLKNWKGDVVSSFDSTTATNAMLTPIIGQVFGFADDQVTGYLNISVGPEGFISGAAGGFGQAAFRNVITAYGKEVPPLFATIAGTYTAPAEALTCDRPPVTVTITAEGKVNLAGKYNLSCGDGTVEVTWDGNDEFQAPYLGGPTGMVELRLDSRKGGGSQEAGGIVLRTDMDGAGAKLIHAISYGAGATGNLASAERQLVKQ